MTAPTHEANRDQAEFWNGAPGQAWILRQEMQDRIFGGLTRRLIEIAALAPGERALDIGCGCGDTTLALAASAGPKGVVLGADISAPMITHARTRAAEQDSKAQFLVADAMTQDFSELGADCLVSRFGVMFFADPVLAFANMRRGLRRGGRVAFVCWREARLNEWAMVPFEAAIKHAPRPPRPGPDEPGPFSFAEPARVRAILQGAGFADVELTPGNFELDLTAGQGLENAVDGTLEIGPASRALRDQPEHIRDAAKAEIREALRARLVDGRIPLGAAVWFVTARNP